MNGPTCLKCTPVLPFMWEYFVHILCRMQSHVCIFFSELCREKNGWRTQNYVDTFDLSFSTVKDNVERVDASKLSYEEFVERYERPYKPVVLTNVQNDWAANYKWTTDVSSMIIALLHISQPLK